jgi:GNAT superfamily N-acetyltransferase
MKVKLAITDDDLMRAFPAVNALRPNLTPENYLPMVKRMMSNGFHLAMLELDNGSVPAIGGFRIDEMFHRGKGVYVDDLSTLEEHRSKGYGEQVLDFIIAYCKAQGCECIHLDSGVQRFRAHRFYLKYGFDIIGHHFALKF